MKYALIGCGRISGRHISAARENGLDIVALCDLIPGKAESAAEKHGLSVGCYTDYRRMLSSEHPDLVAVATTSGTHAKIALDCISAGCNVIIEKPIALSIADADRLISAAKAHNVTVSANHQNRFNRAVAAARRQLEAGAFGKLVRGAICVRWNRNRSYFDQAAWRGTWAEDGGTLMNQCIHGIDLLRWFFGNEVEEVFAYTDNLTHPYIEAEDVGVAVVKFRNGAYATIEGSSTTYPGDLEETLCIFGENGTVKIGGKATNRLDEWIFGDLPDDFRVTPDMSENPTDVYGFGHRELYADVINAINTGRQPYVTLEDGKRALELVLAIYKSSAEHRPVTFPLGDVSTLDFKK